MMSSLYILVTLQISDNANFLGPSVEENLGI
jgi:hypothetical protein